MNEKDTQKLVKTNTILIAVVLIVTLAVVVIGATFAFFSVTASQSTAQSITVTAKKYGGLTFSGAAVTLNNASPGSSTSGTVTVTNSGTSGQGAIKYSLNFVVTENSFTSTVADASDITVSITGGGLSSAATYKLGGVATATKTVVTNKSLNAAATDTYTTVVTFVETTKEQNASQGAKFAAHFEITNVTPVA